MEFDLDEAMDEFRVKATTLVDGMIANAESFGIVPEAPWCPNSLRSVAEKYLMGESEFNKLYLAIFLGEGMVRELGGKWAAIATENRDKLQILVRIYVKLNDKHGTFPYGVVTALEEIRDPGALTVLIDWEKEDLT